MEVREVCIVKVKGEMLALGELFVSAKMSQVQFGM
jgi:hypothetical protein